jgi:hypothetical protein
MEDTGNEHAASVFPVEHNMTTVFQAAQTGPDVITEAAQVRIAGELLATGFQIVYVPNRLVLAPALEGITGNFHQVGFGAAGKTEAGHDLAPLLMQLEPLPDARKRVAFGNPAGVPFVNSGS